MGSVRLETLRVPPDSETGVESWVVRACSFVRVLVARLAVDIRCLVRLNQKQRYRMEQQQAAREGHPKAGRQPPRRLRRRRAKPTLQQKQKQRPNPAKLPQPANVALPSRAHRPREPNGHPNGPVNKCYYTSGAAAAKLHRACFLVLPLIF